MTLCWHLYADIDHHGWSFPDRSATISLCLCLVDIRCNPVFKYCMVLNSYVAVRLLNKAFFPKLSTHISITKFSLRSQRLSLMTVAVSQNYKLWFDQKYFGFQWYWHLKPISFKCWNGVIVVKHTCRLWALLFKRR